MRVVLDTNVVVSAFLSVKGAPARILALWEQGAFDLVVSEPLLAEYERVLAYKPVQARHRMDAQALAEVVQGFRASAIIVEPALRLVIVTEDPDDDKFLECAVAGGAAYIISGDSHLLDLREYQGIQILPPVAFLSLLAGDAL
jgi:uncharacterized protein